MKIASIYKATNTINGKVYIGVDSNWPKRKNGHKCESRKNKGHLFSQSVSKYGWENFQWEIIYQSLDYEYIRDVMENYFICEYRSFIGFDDCNGYNMTLGGEGLLGRKQSDELNKLQSKVIKDMWNDLNSTYNKKEYRDKLKEKRKNRWKETNSIYRTEEYMEKLKKPKTKEHIQKRVDTVSMNWKILTPSGETIIYKNLAKYCRENNLNKTAMRKVSLGQQTNHKGYKCYLVD